MEISDLHKGHTYYCRHAVTGRLLGMSEIDRRRHIHIAGKSGVGKSTFIKSMMAQDFHVGSGTGLIAPDGDLAFELLDLIPSNRTEDVIFFDPSDLERPIGLNVLEGVEPDKRAFVADGVVSALHRIWIDSWGPRLEHFLYNTTAALLDTPSSTLLGIPRMLTDERYRKRIVANVTDPVVRSFWTKEFEGYDKRFIGEAISPVVNKVSRFLSAPAIRNIVGQPKSTIDLRAIMDGEKIFIGNLSKGTAGEEHTRLLGALLITRFYLAALSRADTPEKERKPFFLFVDEAANYATDSFTAILSEARKYALSVAASHQFLEQLPKETSEALFGNAGTLICFRVGSTDAPIFSKELEPMKEAELMATPKYQMWVRPLVDGNVAPRFAGETILSDGLHVGRADIMKEQSRRRFGRPRRKVEERIERFLGR